ncbi:MAG: hypothetical protein K0U52_02190 [Gammaproteobacteria bacterium]|nr:hypothetical protein [Gammaproteobacteria bacterium]
MTTKIILVHSNFSPACQHLKKCIAASSLDVKSLCVDNAVIRTRLATSDYAIEMVPTLLVIDGAVTKYEGLSACRQVVNIVARIFDDDDDDHDDDDGHDDANANANDNDDVPSTLTTITPGLSRTNLASIQENADEDVEDVEDRKTKDLLASGFSKMAEKSDMSESVSTTDIFAQAKAMQQQRSIDDPSAKENEPSTTPREWATANPSSTSGVDNLPEKRATRATARP